MPLQMQSHTCAAMPNNLC